MHVEIVETSDADAAVEPAERPLTQAYLHSAAREDVPWSRWSYAPDPATLRLRCDATTRITTLSSAARDLLQWTDPLQALNWLDHQIDSAVSELASPPLALRGSHAELPPFKGGWIGWFSYDLGRLFESIPTTAPLGPHLPLFEFTFHPSGLACDHQSQNVYRFQTNDPLGAEQPLLVHPNNAGESISFQSNFSRLQYERAVARVIDYIRAGDVFQVNLSQRFTGATPVSAGQIYRRLWKRTAAWFGAYYASRDYALVCDSPELFFRVTPDAQSDGRQIITRPIKGTRPRETGMDVELRESRKDQAELNMIVDLERNDLGRICEIGTVKVSQPRVIEAHPTVYHSAATIEGTLRENVGLVDLLRAIFPGGSVTGAPKIRAMQIIEELEPVRRGPYCGAIGYLSIDGHMQFNVAIRTMIVKDGLIHIPVGGGIVADSDPAAEYEETLVKARAMFAALETAES